MVTIEQGLRNLGRGISHMMQGSDDIDNFQVSIDSRDGDRMLVLYNTDVAADQIEEIVGMMLEAAEVVSEERAAGWVVSQAPRYGATCHITFKHEVLAMTIDSDANEALAQILRDAIDLPAPTHR